MNGRTLALVVLAAAGSGLAGAATYTERTWWQVSDYANGRPYAVTMNAAPSDPVHLSLSHLAAYAQDPVEVGEGTSDCWTNRRCATTRYPVEICFNALAECYNRIYSIGGKVDVGAAIPSLAEVWYVPVGATGYMGAWQEASWEYGQAQGMIEGIPIDHTAAIGVNGVIYVVGGWVGDGASTDVYSTVVNPATGDIGPWRKEPSLMRTASSHGLVYAAGALYTLGGKLESKSFEWVPHQDVQKAEILPNGHLSQWQALKPLPQGKPPDKDPPCECESVPECTDSEDIPCCMAANYNFGWVDTGYYSVGRTIGLVGGLLREFMPPLKCRHFPDGIYGYLNDCNEIRFWAGQKILGYELGFAGSRVWLSNGAYIMPSGQKDDVQAGHLVHSPLGSAGVERDAGYNADATELRPYYEKLFIEETSCKFPYTASTVPAIVVGDFIYSIGALEQFSTPRYDVYRGYLAPHSTIYVDAGYYVSAPLDLGGLVQLRNVKWGYTKTGNGAAGAPGDWVMVRYRLADDTGNWTCWTPRMPEDKNMPLNAAYHEYSARDSAGNTQNRASKYWMPLVDDKGYRYIQIEVSMYKDAGLGDTPAFDRFSVETAPWSPPPEMTEKLEVYPVPAKDEVRVRFRVVLEGAEVKIRVFNVAGDLVQEEARVYSAGGVKEETLSVSRYANGVYFVLVEGRSLRSGKGLEWNGDRLASAKAKLLVRRKK